VGKTFLQLIDSEFSSKHELHKIFNRNTVKVSYSCCRNIKQIVNTHNKQLLSTPTQEITAAGCNCRRKDNCPIPGTCLSKSVVYQATVNTKDAKPDQTYVGLTENAFKTRYTNHLASFKHSSKRNNTELSKHIWTLKDRNINFSIKWSILKQAKAYDNTTKLCNLCLWEKYFIVCRPELSTLNKRNELVCCCRHAKKFLLNYNF